MRASLLVFLASTLATQIMASEEPATRDIMYTAEDGNLKVKYNAVPQEFAHEDIKHADLVGMYNTFKDGQTWLVVDDKRVFRMPDDLGERSEESASDLGTMGPDELKEYLREQPAYGGLHSKLDGVLQARSEALGKRSRNSCRAQRCRSHVQCWPHGDRTGICSTCANRRCSWHATLPNRIA